jgi:hypothetical protein
MASVAVSKLWVGELEMVEWGQYDAKGRELRDQAHQADKWPEGFKKFRRRDVEDQKAMRT